MTRTLFAIALAAIVALPARAQLNDDPLEANLIVSDIARFWEVMDKATDADRAELLQREYIDAGSPGIKGFIAHRIISGEALATTIAQRPDAYSPEARARMSRLLEHDRSVRAPLFALKELYAPAVFPDVYFVVGRLNTGGTTSPAGLLIGAEMYAVSDEKMRELPWIVAHEWAHYNQRYAPDASLLAACIKEGSADFIGELASGGHINEVAHDFGDAHESELWDKFAAAMRQPFANANADGWMYGGAPLPGGPNDLGYYIGYQISEAYYERAADKRQAIADILNIQDFEAFLDASGYADQFGGMPPPDDTPPPPAPTVVSIAPPNGAADVNPTTSEIVVVFSEPMTADYSVTIIESREKFPPVSGLTWSDDQRTLTLHVNLAPGRSYAYGLNAPGFSGFRSAAGVALAPVQVRFVTRSD